MRVFSAALTFLDSMRGDEMRFLISVLAFGLVFNPTMAQTPGPFITGQQLTAQQLNSAFAGKQDYPPPRQPTVVIYGDPTGTADSGVACNAAISSLSPTVGGHVKFATTGTYKFTQTCNFGGFVEPAQLTIDLQGVTISTVGVSAFSRLPPDQTTALQWVGARVNIIGGTLVGDLTAGTYGILMSACYSCTIEKTEIQRYDTAIDGVFCLNCHFHDIRGFGNLTSFVTLEDGASPVTRWTGATVNNSASNNSTINNARDYARSGQVYQYKIVGTDGVHLIDNIAEGSNPNFNIWFSDHAATTVKNLWIDNMHIENQPTVSKMYFTSGITGGTGTGGCCGGYVVTVERIMDQGGGTSVPLIDASQISTSADVIAKYVWVTYSGMWSSGMTQSWRLDNIGNGSQDPYASSFWVGGMRPTSGFLGMSRTPAGGGYELFSNILYLGTPYADNGGVDALTYFDSSQLFAGMNDHYGIGTNNAGTEYRFTPHIARIGTGGVTMTSNAASTANDSNLSGVAANVLRATSWLQQAGGDQRMDANLSIPNTTFVTLNGTGRNLTAVLAAGRTYRFEADVYVNSGGNAGGLQLQVAGTGGLTATAIVYDGYLVSSSGMANYAQATALGTPVANGVAGATLTGYVHGTITVNAAGTLAIQGAQSASNATPTVIERGSVLTVRDLQ
jgi:hypothetical protein